MITNDDMDAARAAAADLEAWGSEADMWAFCQHLSNRQRQSFSFYQAWKYRNPKPKIIAEYRTWLADRRAEQANSPLARALPWMVGAVAIALAGLALFL